MPRTANIHYLLIFYFLIPSFYSFPQSSQFTFRHLTTKQGLPSNIINSIIKDKDGFMWFGTDHGLSRYDGYNFIAYQLPDNAMSESGSQVINKILEDINGNLWVGTSQQGLQKFDRITETFTAFKHNPVDANSLSNNAVNTIYQDREGVLWVGTDGGGLNKYDLKNEKFTSFMPDKENPDGSKNRVFTIFEDKTGAFWIGTQEGLFLFDREKRIFTGFDLGKEIPAGNYRRVNCITEDRNGILWIGTMWGMFKYDRYNGEIKNYLPMGITPGYSEKPATFISNLYVKSIVETVQNGKHILWIAAKWGLNKLDVESEKFEAIHENKNNPQSLSTSFLKNLYLDDTGLLWIGTGTSGADVLNTRFNLFHELIMKDPDNNYSFQPACFLQDNTETLWVGGTEGGIFQYDKYFNQTGRYALWRIKPDTFDMRHNNRINCIYKHSENTLWLGFYQWGLVLFDKELKTFRKVELRNNTGAPHPTTIENIIYDKYGLLWVGTNSGLYIKNKNEGVLTPAQIIRHDELNKAEITNLFEDSKNNLWISTKNSGLYCLKPDNRPLMQFVRYEDNSRDRNGFFGNYVHSVYEDRQGTLWFGSDKGLNIYNFRNEEFEAVTDFNDDYAGHIFRIYGDAHDKLWISHATKGLIRYQPYNDKTNKIKAFDVSDGLPFDNFNTFFSPANSFYQSADGSLFIGAETFIGHSFFWFQPDSIKDNKHIPPVVLTALNVANKTFSLDSSITVKKQITLKYNENFFSFEFTALDFQIPEKNQYAYYLEGFEEKWNHSGNRRFANYTGVPPGEYTFRVKGSNNDGYWNEDGTSIHISITPPFWKTWWAYVLYGLIIMLIIYSIIHYYLRRHNLLHNLALEQIETEKLKELDGLKTKFFTNISHEFRTPLTLILGPLQQLSAKINDQSDKLILSMVIQNARRLRDLVNQLLSLSKLESGKMKLQCIEVNIIEFVRNHVQSFESLATQYKISLKFSADQKEILAFIDEEKIAQVLNNLLSNAFKFTGEEGEIEVEVSSPQSAEGSSQLADHRRMAEDCLLKTEDSDGRCIAIRISDTGPGIPPEKLPHIFDRFFQADDSISREQEGTGIGLAIVKEMVNLHYGDIQVISKPGEGTTFLILLPLGQSHLKPDEITETKETNNENEKVDTELPKHQEETLSHSILNPQLATRNPKPATKEDSPILLIVEDNPDMRTFIRGYFEDTYQIFEAGNGHEGLSMAIEHIPDIIISDVMMPKMDGYAFCDKIKTDERTCHIPVILLTARASKESRMEGLKTGADDFITKPFDGEELQVRVKNLIDQRKKLSEFYQKDFKEIPQVKKEHVLSMDQKFLQKAKTVVDKNLSNSEYGVDDFARDMALSRSQLHRKLSALVNQSVTEFIRTIRLNYAIGLLKSRARTISEIAYDAGFNSPTYFSISFKKHYGISPSEYLNNLDQ